MWAFSDYYLDVSKLDVVHNVADEHRASLEKYPATRNNHKLPPPIDMPAWLEYSVKCTCGIEKFLTEDDKSKIQMKRYEDTGAVKS